MDIGYARDWLSNHLVCDLVRRTNGSYVDGHEADTLPRTMGHPVVVFYGCLHWSALVSKVKRET